MAVPPTTTSTPRARIGERSRLMEGGDGFGDYVKATATSSPCRRPPHRASSLSSSAKPSGNSAMPPLLPSPDTVVLPN
eukprot:scaffold2619_cov72-Cyclotella_meneghiniana.AAC.1